MIALLRKIAAIAVTDIRIEFQDRSTWLFMFVLPLLFTAMLGSLSGGDFRSKVAVVDADGSAVSRSLLEALEASAAVNSRDLSAADASAEFDSGDVAAVVTIPAGFGDALLSGGGAALTLRSASRDPAVVTIERELRSALDGLTGATGAARAAATQAEEIRPFADPAARRSFVSSALVQAKALLDAPPAITRVTTAPQATLIPVGFTASSPGQLVTWTLVTLLTVSEVFVAERLAGTLSRLLITPTRRATILAGKVTGRFVLGLVQMGVLIVFGAVVFGVDWGQSPVALAMVVVSFALAAIGLGMVLAAVSRTRAQAGQLSVMLAMTMAALGGAWFPLEVTPPAFQSAVRIFPSTWAMAGLQDVIVRGQGPEGVLLETLVLLAFAALFFAVAARRLRWE